MDLFFIFFGAFLGSASYIAAYGIFRRHISEVWAVGFSNGCFSFCLGILSCQLLKTKWGIEQDYGVSLAVSFSLAMFAPWIMHKAMPNITKRLLSSLNPDTLRALLLRLLGIQEPPDKK